VTATTVAPIVDALSGKRYRYNTEADLHRALMAALDAAGIAYRREVFVPGGRIDFVVGRVGVEVKIKGSATSLARQIGKYALAEELDAFLVVTTRPAHRAIPAFANDKPVHVMTIGGLSL